MKMSTGSLWSRVVAVSARALVPQIVLLRCDRAGAQIGYGVASTRTFRASHVYHVRSFHASVAAAMTKSNHTTVYLVDERLAKLTGTSRVNTKKGVVNAVAAYVRKQGLQLDSDKKKFRCDEELEKLLGRKQMFFMHIPKSLSPVLDDVENKGTESQIEEANALRAHMKEEEEVREAQRLKAMEAKKLVEEQGLKAKEKEKLVKEERLAAKEKKKLRRTKAKERASEIKAKKVGIFTEYKLSPKLQEVCGKPIMSRPEVLQALWKYVKEKKLTNDGLVVPDEKLEELFGFKESFEGLVAFTRSLEPHLTKVTSSGEIE